MIKRILTIFFCMILLAGCGEKENLKTSTKNEINITQVYEEILSNKDNFDDYSKQLVSSEFLNWLYENFGEDVINNLNKQLKSGKISNEDWHQITGNTATVLNDLYSGVLDKDNTNYRNDIKVIKTENDSVTIRIVGDVSLADNWKILPKIQERNKGIYGVLSEKTVNLLKTADIFLLNNEFTFSNRGEKLIGKMYTFRADPKHVNYFHEIGADIVSLANNHAYDFGADAFADTLETLKDASLPYIGGGENITEAAKPYYFIVNGRKFAFSAATRAEKNIKTPEAKENSSGVMRTYDPTKYIETIKTAELECDYNIVYVHWGAEGSHEIEDGLYEMGAKYIDAGADIVVGAHAHILQGIQYYKNVPIVYNLGNFIFNDKTIDTGILEINLTTDGTLSYKFIPAIQKDCYTKIVDGEEKSRILEFMEELSIDVDFDENGVFTEKN